MIKRNRKTKIYLFNIIAAIACSYFINDAGKYKMILDFMLYSSIAFFTSNVISKKFNANENTQIDSMPTDNQ